MLTIKYDGVVLGTYEYNALTRLHTLTLNKLAMVKMFRRFISRELMNGTEYSSSATKELAVAIITAFATPTLQFVQQAHSTPQWAEYLTQWTTNETLKG